MGIAEEVREDFRRGKLQGSDRPASANATVVRSRNTTNRTSQAFRSSTSELKVGIGGRVNPEKDTVNMQDMFDLSQQNIDSRMPVGTLIDTQIRSLQESPAVASILEGSARTRNIQGHSSQKPGASTNFSSPEARAMLLSDTYKNAMDTLKPADTVKAAIDPMTGEPFRKRPVSASASGPPRMSMKDRVKMTLKAGASHGASPAPTKLSKASSASKTRPRPSSANGTRKDKGGDDKKARTIGSAHALLNDLQSLNPAILFG